jgi:hypothetical protein
MYRQSRLLVLHEIADAHRDGKRFVVRAEEKLTASLEPEAAALGLRPEPICGGLALRLKE